MARLYEYINVGYDGGQNDSVAADQLARNEGVLLQNGYIRAPGKFIKRAGISVIGTDTDTLAIEGLTSWTTPSGVKYQLRMTKGKLQYNNAGTWTNMDTGFTSGLPCEFVPAAGKLYIFNGTENIHSWDGAAVTLNSCLTDLGNTTVPKGKYAIYWKNYMIIWGGVVVNGTAYKSRAFFSNLGDPTTWSTASDYFPVNENDGFDGTGIFGIDKFLVLGKERSVHIMTGTNPTDWKLTSSVNNIVVVDGSIGVASHRSMCQVGNDVWFMGTDAQMHSVVRNEQGATPLTGIVSGKIRGTLASINTTQLSKVACIVFSGRIYVAFATGSSTFNNKVMVADTFLAGSVNATTGISTASANNPFPWVTYTGWNAACWSIYTPSSTPQLYFGEASAHSYTYQAETGTNDNTVAIDFDYKSGMINLAAPEKSKDFRFVIVSGDTGGNYIISLYQSVDSSTFLPLGSFNLSAGDVWGTGVWGTAMWGFSSEKQQKYVIQTNSPKLMIRARNNAADQPVTINTYTIVLKPRKTR